jgi:hypothetical protein
MSLLAGFGLGFALGQGLGHRNAVASWGTTLDKVLVAKSPDPVKTAAALGELETTKALIMTPQESFAESEEPKPVQNVLIDGMDFEFPGDSPLNKLT